MARACRTNKDFENWDVLGIIRQSYKGKLAMYYGADGVWFWKPPKKKGIKGLWESFKLRFRVAYMRVSSWITGRTPA